MGKELALFDFDGTISTKDTLLEFMIFVKGYCGAAAVFFKLVPSAIRFSRKKISNQEFKERFLTLAYQGLSHQELKKQAVEFTKKRLPDLIRPKATERLEWHRENNHRIVIVSASTKLWLSPWCEQEKVELICSALEVVDGKVTGRLEGLNCRGPEKVERIKSEINLVDYEKTYAYGDSSGDTEMLEFADDGQYRPFE